MQPPGSPYLGDPAVFYPEIRDNSYCIIALLEGSGKYFRNVSIKPEDSICMIELDEKGENYRIVWGLVNGGRPTSELPSHLDLAFCSLLFHYVIFCIRRKETGRALDFSNVCLSFIFYALFSCSRIASYIFRIRYPNMVFCRLM